MTPKFLEPTVHEKGWGSEVWIINEPKYCLKCLYFNKGASFSMHYHLLKEETWYVVSGCITLEYFDLKNGKRHSKVLSQGNIVDILPGVPHKLTALDATKIIEVSTQHFETDSYRVEPGDSQKIKEL